MPHIHTIDEVDATGELARLSGAMVDRRIADGLGVAVEPWVQAAEGPHP